MFVLFRCSLVTLIVVVVVVVVVVLVVVAVPEGCGIRQSSSTLGAMLSYIKIMKAALLLCSGSGG